MVKHPGVLTGIDNTGLLNMDIWRRRFAGNQWKAYLEEGLQEAGENDILRLATRTGHTLRSEEFILHREALPDR